MEQRVKTYIESLHPADRVDPRTVVNWIKKRVIWGRKRGGQWWVDPERDPREHRPPTTLEVEDEPVNPLVVQVLEEMEQANGATTRPQQQKIA